jgi:hypothetical protein
LANFTADATCKYDSAYKYYRIINNCNYYLAHRDTTLLTGSRKVAIPEYAEALAVRAWTYIQLCRQYGEVPFYTDPITSIGDANRQLPLKNLQAICDELAPEMMRYSGTPVPDYKEVSAGTLNGSDTDNPTDKKVQSRTAMLPIDLVLGDLFLETHQYEQAAHYYTEYITRNQLVMRQAYINPNSNNLLSLLEDRLPTTMYNSFSGYSWESIFNGGTTDIVTYIPLAANRLRGVVTELPRYFGYDFYSTTTGTQNSSARYLLERQVDASAPYVALSEAQDYYYTPTAPTTGKVSVLTAPLGDLRRLVTMRQTAKNDSAFAVMIKFNSANVPLYRNATVYLRLAEAINRMGYPDVAFAILKDGINADLLSYVQHGDSTDLVNNRYLRNAAFTYAGKQCVSPTDLLTTTLPFLSSRYEQYFTANWGIHSRGTNYTRGSDSPYQMDTLVVRKQQELATQLGIAPTGTLDDQINAVEDIICDEMALELAFEGTRFGDLTRIARHKNQAGLYGSDFGTRWLARKLAYKAAGLETRLQDERNWYLPIK